MLVILACAGVGPAFAGCRGNAGLTPSQAQRIEAAIWDLLDVEEDYPIQSDVFNERTADYPKDDVAFVLLSIYDQTESPRRRDGTMQAMGILVNGARLNEGILARIRQTASAALLSRDERIANAAVGALRHWYGASAVQDLLVQRLAKARGQPLISSIMAAFPPDVAPTVLLHELSAPAPPPAPGPDYEAWLMRTEFLLDSTPGAVGPTPAKLRTRLIDLMKEHRGLWSSGARALIRLHATDVVGNLEALADSLPRNARASAPLVAALAVLEPSNPYHRERLLNLFQEAVCSQAQAGDARWNSTLWLNYWLSYAASQIEDASFLEAIVENQEQLGSERASQLLWRTAAELQCRGAAVVLVALNRMGDSDANRKLNDSPDFLRAMRILLAKGRGAAIGDPRQRAEVEAASRRFQKLLNQGGGQNY